jgi:L-alanine-DL-glutamate epimerase-like enolase superfamily enzyme
VKIVGADSFLLKIPVDNEIADSMRSVQHLEIVGLTVQTDAGITGTGYTITVGHGASVIKEILDSLYVPDLIGRDPHLVREIWQSMYFGRGHWIGRVGATSMAQSAVDIALWDIIAKAAELPLWRLLGAATAAPMPVYNTHAGWLNFSIEQLREQAKQLLDQGYTALKMKVGGADIYEDQRRVAAVRKAVGDQVLLMVDANQKWDPMRAALGAKLLEQFNLSWLEEPMNPDDIAAHAHLKQRSSIPIALGEHLYSTVVFRDYITQRAVDVVQVDVCKIGGITPWLEVAAVANAHGLRVCPHCGDLMQVHQHLVRAITNRWFLEVIPMWNKGPFKNQILIKDGVCLTPTEPGASTDITAEAFERFRVA